MNPAVTAYSHYLPMALGHVLVVCMLLMTTLMISGCSSKGIIFEPIDSPPRWPGPPETARIHYIGQLRTDKDLKPSRSFVQGLSEKIFGQDPSRSMLTPYAVCTDSHNRIFICDSNAQTVHAYDLDTRKYEQFKPDAPEAQFAQPVGITYDSLDRILVSDSAAGTIFIFDSNGKYLGTMGESELSKPTGLAFDPATNQLLVADVGTHQILAFSLDGQLLQRVGRRGTQLGEFNFPTNVAIGHDGAMYVSDTLNFRVQVFDQNLKPLRQIGQKGDLPGYFSHPKGLALDSDDHLYVLDSHFESVQIFDPQGKLLLSFGEEGTGPGQFWLPTGIYIDADDRIWIADSYNQRVQVFQYRPETQP